MAKIKRSVLVKAPAEKVYKYLADFKKQPDWIPGSVEVLGAGEAEVGKNYKFKYKMAGILMEGEASVKELVPNKKIGFRTKGAVASDWLLVLNARDGGTEVELNIEYTIPVPVLGKVAEKIILKRNERETDHAMENLREALEA